MDRGVASRETERRSPARIDTLRRGPSAVLNDYIKRGIPINRKRWEWSANIFEGEPRSVRGFIRFTSQGFSESSGTPGFGQGLTGGSVLRNHFVSLLGSNQGVISDRAEGQNRDDQVCYSEPEVSPVVPILALIIGSTTLCLGFWYVQFTNNVYRSILAAVIGSAIVWYAGFAGTRWVAEQTLPAAQGIERAGSRVGSHLSVCCARDSTPEGVFVLIHTSDGSVSAAPGGDNGNDVPRCLGFVAREPRGDRLPALRPPRRRARCDRRHASPAARARRPAAAAERRVRPDATSAAVGA
jgi:hypothetical protein